MSAPAAKPVPAGEPISTNPILPDAATESTASVLAVHQVCRGSATAPAIYVAESTGWSHEALCRAALALYSHQTEKQWHDLTDTQAAIYAFVKHTTRSTANVEIAAPHQSVIGDRFKTNKVVRDALSAAKKSTATFTIASDGGISPAVLEAPLDIAHLAIFFS